MFSRKNFTPADDRRVAGAALRPLVALTLCAALAAAGALSPRQARACGGLFCNAQTPVNQTAERIIFVDHGDGTTTAAIEIMYQGTAERFAWVLPLGDIDNPDTDIRVSSVQALDRLQQATNPVYRLTREVEGTCGTQNFDSDGVARGAPTGAAGGFANDAGVLEDGGVVVEASGSVGPFDYEFISVTAGTTDPAALAIEWLDANGYDVGIGDELLAPYLESGMKLLAVRLTKGNDTGSIRPLMITYQGTSPSIPIRPTAVAAQDDMGVMVFMGSAARAIPKNYKSLQLNDALLDWFTFGSNYGDVVNAAADEAGGQGFVTEFAGASNTLQDVVVQQWERDNWNNIQGQTFTSDGQMLDAVRFDYGGWDGFSDAVRAALTVTGTVTATDVLNCPSCYLDGADPGVTFDRAAFRTALYEQVIKPMFDTEDLVQEMPYVTRLYTTMSAEDMTLDPVFDANPDLDDVDNNHTATMVIECSQKYFEFEAPFRVELPSGLVVRGGDQNVWPVTFATEDEEGEPLPAALTIAEVGVSGPEDVILDNAPLIAGALAAMPAPNPPGTAGGDGSGLFGCASLPGQGGGAAGVWALLGLSLLSLRRRRR